MKSGTLTTITISGKTKSATYLGKGRHAKAYLDTDGVLLFVRSCLMKEAIANIDHVHVPKISYVTTKADGVHVWRMPFYRPLNAKNEKA